ncbi:MAG: glycosyltransferase [Rickettsiales bacterium]|nr:glycosyltransferase [Rickettsiales bacterium]
MLIDNKKIRYNESINFQTFHTIATNEELECIYDGKRTLISVAPKDNAICISRDEFTKLLLDVFRDWIVEFCQNTRKGMPTVKNINYAKFKVICITILVCVFLMLSFGTTAKILLTFVIIYNSFCLLCKCWIVLSSWLRGTLKQEIRQFETEEYQCFKHDGGLPIYTILVPMFHENEETINQMLNSLRNINYPKDKLDVKLVLEEDDTQTRDILNDIPSLEEWITKLWVPYFEPRTKPKACNVAALFAKGEYLVIFDAEDKPEPEQLLKAVYTFHHHPEVDILQGCLSFYNHNQNLLTAWFNVEYTTWFKLTLPELSRRGIALPLGGTSNHIRTSFLFKHFWDSYHVTEDLELTTITMCEDKKSNIMHLASDTTEWCVVDVKSWFKQRTRWMKGYLLTYYLTACNRHYNSNIRSVFFLHCIVGYATVAYLLIPVLLSLSILGLLDYLLAFGLIFVSSFLYYMTLILSYAYAANITYTVNKKNLNQIWKLIFTLILYPFYFSLHFVATWIAVIDTWKRPFYWAKTMHGVK